MSFEITDPQDAMVIASALRVYTALFPALGGAHAPEMITGAIEKRSEDIHEKAVEVARPLSEEWAQYAARVLTGDDPGIEPEEIEYMLHWTSTLLNIEAHADRIREQINGFARAMTARNN